MSSTTFTPRPAVRPLDFRDEVLRAIVDRVGRTEAQARRALFVAAGGRDRRCSERLRKHDGGPADAAGAAVHEHGLARREAGRA